uniref:Uncharacterized protein n=1 Tax=Sphaerodactylus townsendi TaxID=933632 RepID=A0ACB8EVW6_9SAUR
MPTVHPEGSGAATDTLYITPAEQKLWGQLTGILSPALWEAEASGSLQGESGVISFSGSREVILRAKEAVSKLLILVGSVAKISRMVLPQTEQRAVGFFHLSEGLDLLLWEGEASRFRADAAVRIGPKGDLGCGSAVFAERVLSHRGSPCINVNVFLSCPQTVELGAGAVKLALEAASQKGLQSLTMTYADLISSTYQAKAVALGIEAFAKDHPASPLKTIHFVSSDRDAVAAFHRECEELWPPGTGHRDQLRSMLMSLEHVKAEVISGYSAKQKTDVVVVPLVLESDGMVWGPDSLAIMQRVLKIVPQATNLLPEEILSVTASAFPEFDCRELYVVRLAGSQVNISISE